MLSRSLGLASALATLLVTAPLLAQEPPPPPTDEELPKPRPTAEDTRSGHPTLALEYAYGSLFGHAEDSLDNSYGRDVTGVSQSWFAGYGFTPRLQLAYPFHRNVAVELRGSWSSYGGTSRCGGCSAKSATYGAGLVYHLVDGIPFDPWFAYGLSYRKTDLSGPGFSASYAGVDFLRWTVGMDYYPVKQLGFGPIFEVTYGTYLSRTNGTLDDRAFPRQATLFGARVVLAPF